MRRRWVVVAALTSSATAGFGPVACHTFQSADDASADGGADAARDADPEASTGPDSPIGDGLIACQTEAGTCQLPEVCCLSYNGASDWCMARPASVNGPCDAGSPDTRIAECDDVDDCTGTDIVCCLIALGSGNKSLVCIGAAACASGGERACNLHTDDCPSGSHCIPRPESPYATCK
jgi:hypothetical protein